MLAQVPHGNTEMVAAGLRTMFAQPDAHVAEQLETIAIMFGRQLPKAGQMMRATREDVLTFIAFPQ